MLQPRAWPSVLAKRCTCRSNLRIRAVGGADAICWQVGRRVDVGGIEPEVVRRSPAVGVVGVGVPVVTAIAELMRGGFIRTLWIELRDEV